MTKLNFTPTPQQQLIVERACANDRNLIIEARAGSAKTSTLKLVANALPSTVKGIAIAFNVAIKDELAEALPDNFQCVTMNSLGHRAVGAYFRRKLFLKKNKNYGILKELVERLEPADREEAYNSFSRILKLIANAKQHGYVHGLAKSAMAKPVLSADDFWFSIDTIPTPLEQDLTNLATAESWRQIHADGVVDFDDQILFPAICSVTFDHFDYVLIDEAQDLSILQHIILGKLVRKRSRLIAVGDPCQAIYGFRGADEDSINKLAERFDAERLYLTVCFRCPTSVIEEARWRAPDMLWPDGTRSGTVESLTSWTADTIPADAAILCRNNAPLFRTALRLMKAGRYPEFKGRDIVQNLIKRMSELGKESDPTIFALANIKAWVEREKEKSKNLDMISDIAECMRLFLEETETLGEAIGKVRQLHDQTGRIKLATGHRAKGLEYDVVFFLDADLCRPKGQDSNIKYVIQTRARERLVYIQSGNFTGPSDIELNEETQTNV